MDLIQEFPNARHVYFQFSIIDNSHILGIQKILDQKKFDNISSSIDPNLSQSLNNLEHIEYIPTLELDRNYYLIDANNAITMFILLSDQIRTLENIFETIDNILYELGEFITFKLSPEQTAIPYETLSQYIPIRQDDRSYVVGNQEHGTAVGISDGLGLEHGLEYSRVPAVGISGEPGVEHGVESGVEHGVESGDGHSVGPKPGVVASQKTLKQCQRAYQEAELMANAFLGTELYPQDNGNILFFEVEHGINLEKNVSSPISKEQNYTEFKIPILQQILEVYFSESKLTVIVRSPSRLKRPVPESKQISFPNTNEARAFYSVMNSIYNVHTGEFTLKQNIPGELKSNKILTDNYDQNPNLFRFFYNLLVENPKLMLGDGTPGSGQLEQIHCYIQLLFPNHVYTQYNQSINIVNQGNNFLDDYLSHSLYRLRYNINAQIHLIISLKLMFYFFTGGTITFNNESNQIFFEVNFENLITKERLTNLFREHHNALRITRMLTFLGIMGRRDLQIGLYNSLLYCLERCSTNTAYEFIDFSRYYSSVKFWYDALFAENLSPNKQRERKYK